MNSVNSQTINKLVNSPIEVAKNNPLPTFIFVVILLVLLYVSGRYGYNYYMANLQPQITRNVLIPDSKSGLNAITISNTNLPSGQYASNEYSISFWLNNHNNSHKQGQRKFVMRRGSVKSNVNPEIYLDPYKNELHVLVSNATKIANATTTTATTTATTIAGGETTTTTTAGGSTTTTASPVLNESFQPTCDCDQITPYQEIMDSISTNTAFVPPPEYDSQYFEMISGNEVAQTPENTRPEFTPYMNIMTPEQFVDTNPPCVSPVATETKEDRDYLEKTGNICSAEYVLNTWNHFVVMLHSNYIEIYRNGDIVKSCIIEGSPVMVMDDLLINPDGGFDGFIANIQHFNSVLSVDEVRTLYKESPTPIKNILSDIPMWAWGVLGLICVFIIALTFNLT